MFIYVLLYKAFGKYNKKAVDIEFSILTTFFYLF